MQLPIPVKFFNCFGPFTYNTENGQTYLKSCGVQTARFLMYAWPFLNMMNERVNEKAILNLFSSEAISDH